MTDEILICAGVVGAALLAAVQVANQQNWLDAGNTAYRAANATGGALMFACSFIEWNTALALFAALWTAIHVFGLAANLLRARTTRR